MAFTPPHGLGDPTRACARGVAQQAAWAPGREDSSASGRRFRTANLKDDCTRECPAILVDFSLPGGE
jgi:hypothetical protein